MNKAKIKEIIIIINKYLLYVGLILISIGLGATYQAQHDVTALNESLNYYAINNAILTDGHSYYNVIKYNTNYSSVNYLLNLSQCNALYGVNK